jgi:hypothetical protein
VPSFVGRHRARAFVGRNRVRAFVGRHRARGFVGRARGGLLRAGAGHRGGPAGAGGKGCGGLFGSLVGCLDLWRAGGAISALTHLRHASSGYAAAQVAAVGGGQGR